MLQRWCWRKARGWLISCLCRSFVVAFWLWQLGSVWSWGNVAGPLGARIWHVNYQFNYLNMTSCLCFPNWSESCFKYFSFTRGGRGWGGVFYILLHLFLLLLFVSGFLLYFHLFFSETSPPLSVFCISVASLEHCVSGLLHIGLAHFSSFILHLFSHFFSPHLHCLSLF